MLNKASERMLKASMNLEKHQKAILSSSNTDSIGAKKSVIPNEIIEFVYVTERCLLYLGLIARTEQEVKTSEIHRSTSAIHPEYHR